MGENAFCLSEYDIIGFDVDHTLAKYDLTHLFKLTHKATGEFLVKSKGYGEDLLQDLDQDFCTKGLIYDVAHGNLLKIGLDGSVVRGSHGTSMMTRDELTSAYGEDHMFEHFEELRNKVTSCPRYRIFENYFDMPVAVSCARIVDSIDKNTPDSPLYDFWNDVMSSFRDAFLYSQYSDNSGGFFPVLKKNPEKYLRPCSEKVKSWLRMLRKQGKYLFLMTSSFVDFGSLVMKTVLGPDWESYFDVCFFYARKPSFFTDNSPFLRLDGDVEREPVEIDTDKYTKYSQGNLPDIMKHFRTVTGKDHPKVVYVGDSIRSDVFPAKKHADWGVVLITEEMEAEGYALLDNDEEENGEPQTKRTKIEKFTSTLDQQEKEHILSQKFGSLFYDPEYRSETPLPSDKNGCENGVGVNWKQMNTFWGDIITQYADIAIPNLEYIVDLPLDHRFETFKHESGNTRGFHPGPPLSLVT